MIEKIREALGGVPYIDNHGQQAIIGNISLMVCTKESWEPVAREYVNKYSELFKSNCDSSGEVMN